VPLVLHGGTGIRAADVRAAIRAGIAKINVATAIRQPYERLMRESGSRAQEAVYEATVAIVRDELAGDGKAGELLG
jgi:fructose-bisphosphate aldolase class II